jgi:hypothetical protein
MDGLGGSRTTSRGFVLAAVAFTSGRVALADSLRNMYDRALGVVILEPTPRAITRLCMRFG